MWKIGIIDFFGRSLRSHNINSLKYPTTSFLTGTYIFARMQKMSIQLAVQSIYNIWYYFCKDADTNKDTDTNILEVFVTFLFIVYQNSNN